MLKKDRQHLVAFFYGVNFISKLIFA